LSLCFKLLMRRSVTTRDSFTMYIIITEALFNTRVDLVALMIDPYDGYMVKLNLIHFC